MKNLLKVVVVWLLWVPTSLVLWRGKPTVVAVTGSAGKTTTKRAIGAVMQAGFGDRVLVGFGNLGTAVGVPLAIFEINLEDPSPWACAWYLPIIWLKGIFYLIFGYPYRYLVLEVSADLPGGIAYMARKLKPKVAVITNIGPSHTEFFNNEDGVAREKLSLVRFVPKDGLVITGQNVPEPKTDAKVITVDDGGLNFAPTVARKIGAWLNIESSKIEKALEHNVKLPGRFDKLKGKNQTIVIDSSYNANPVSMKAMIDEVVADPELAKKSGARRVAVLGDMLELGKDTLEHHREVYDYAKQYFDLVITVGKITEDLQASQHFSSAELAGAWLVKNIQSGDIIFIKGSHGVHLEKTVKMITNNREKK